MTPPATYIFAADLWFTVAALFLLEAIAIYAWRFRREPGAMPLVGLQAGKAVWLVARLVIYSTSGRPQSPFWVGTAVLASQALSYAGFRFLAELWGLGQRARRSIDFVNLALLAATAAAMLTNRRHHLFWLPPAAGSSVAALEGGLLERLWMAMSIGLNLLYFVLCVAWFVRERGLRRRQVGMILLAIVISWGAWLLASHPELHVPEPMPIGFVLSSLVMTWAFVRWRLLGLMPLAQETVLNERVAGMMILDLSGRIVALNTTVRSLFPSPMLAVGDSVDKAVENWPALALLTDATGESRFDAGRQLAERRTVYEVAQTPLRSTGGHPLGRVVTFTDVTEERRAQSARLEHSILNERKHLGQELHDDGQVWFFLASQAQTAQHLLRHDDPVRALRIVDRMVAVHREHSLGMRESMLGLQSELSDRLDLPQAIEEQLAWYRRHCELDVQLCLDPGWDASRVPLHMQAQLLRIAQEALANARKHASATKVNVDLRLGEERLTLSVADDGCGFDFEAAALAKGRAGGHFGLKAMRERAESIGAHFALAAAPGTGSRITVELPLQ